MTRYTEEWLAERQRRQAMPAAAPAPAPVQKPSKYRNKRCQSADGKWFDSMLERDYYEQLLLRWRAGDVLWFVRQVNFELEGGVRYRADFVVVTTTGTDVVDTTGVMTPAKRDKLKQMMARYRIDVQLVRST